MEKSCRAPITIWIFSKAGVAMFWHLISQMQPNDIDVSSSQRECFVSRSWVCPNRTENALPKIRENVMQFFEAISVHRNEIGDNHRGYLGRPRSNAEKEDLQKTWHLLFLKRISSERTNTVTVYIIHGLSLFTNHATLSVWKHCWQDIWKIKYFLLTSHTFN